MKRPLLCLALLGALAGCSAISPEARIRERLIEAGVKPPMAGCLADKLARKLDYSELRELDRVVRLPREHPGTLSFDELGDRLRALNNPHIVSVVTRAGLGCAIAG